MSAPATKFEHFNNKNLAKVVPPPMSFHPHTEPDPDSYDAVIFGFDGTLVNSVPNLCKIWNLTIEGLTDMTSAIEPLEFNRLFADKGSFEIAEFFSQQTGVLPGQLLIAANLMRMSLKDGWQPNPLSVQFAKEAYAAGKRLAIVTNENVEYVEHVLNCTRIFEPEPFVMLCVEPKKVRPGRSLPCPDMLFVCALSFGIDPSRCLVVDGTNQGLEAARRAGIRSGMRGFKEQPILP